VIPASARCSAFFLFVAASAAAAQALSVKTLLNGPPIVGEPRAMAYDARGTLIIADARYNRIAAIDTSGRSMILAGPRADELPGYADGDAAAARFRTPAGIAIAKDGAIYVADAGNHVIRSITPDHQVHTIAGSLQAGSRDGLGAQARFTTPTGLAADTLGNLYVADPDSGVRKIDSQRNVTTLALDCRRPVQLALYGPQKFTYLFVSCADGLLMYRTWDNYLVRFPVDASENAASNSNQEHIERLEGFRSIGQPYAIAALDDHDLLYTDPTQNVVRYIDGNLHLGRIVASAPRIPSLPISIAQASSTRWTLGSRDGRIVQISNLDLRKPATPGLGDLLPPGFAAERAIFIVGNSFVWWNTDWPDSIPGQLERSLRSKWGTRGGGVRVVPVLLPDARLAPAEQFITTVAEAGLMHSVLLDINAELVARTFSLDVAQLMQHPSWIPPLLADLQRLSNRLRGNGTSLIVVLQPEDFELGQAPARTLESLRAGLVAAKIHVIDLYPAFRTADHNAALFGVRDKHPEAAGRALAGREIARQLTRLMPSPRP